MSDLSGLNVTDLHFAYSGEGFRVQVPRLDVSGGKALALAGPSGAGKSTLLRLFTGLLTPNAGKICLGSTQIDLLNHEQRRAFRLKHIGLVFQDFALLDYLTVIENILLPHQFRDGSADTPVRLRMQDLTERLHIDQYVNKRVSQLSQGERQRVAVARALVHEPKLIICDEPTAALDAKNGHVVMELFESVARGSDRAVLIVTHDNRIFHHANRIASMDDGKIIEVHDVDEQHPVPRGLLHGEAL